MLIPPSPPGRRREFKIVPDFPGLMYCAEGEYTGRESRKEGRETSESHACILLLGAAGNKKRSI